MAQDMADLSCWEFCAQLASSAPVPGGGGAAALCGALASALGEMVIHLTLGKKKYAAVEQEFRDIEVQCAALREELLNCMQEDADEFLPLSAAYALPKSTPEEQRHRTEVLEQVSRQACRVPLKIMVCCARILDLLEIIAARGSVLALSDAAAGAILCLAAMESASLNVYINTASLKDRETAAQLDQQSDGLLRTCRERATGIYTQVLAQIRAI